MDTLPPKLVYAIDQVLLLKRLIAVLEAKPYKNFYRMFIPKPIRTHWQVAVDKKQQIHLYEQFLLLVGHYANNDLPIFSIKAKKQLPRDIIWQYWGQGFSDLPDTVKLCFASVEQHKGDYDIIRLSDDTINDYIELPDFVWQKKDSFRPAFFADVLRLALLYCYGGVWVDATILLTAPIDDALICQDFFMFSRDPKAANKDAWQRFGGSYFGWDNDHHVNILNSFIISDPHHPTTHACLQLLLTFWYHQRHVSQYFFFQILFDALTTRLPKHQIKQPKDDTKAHLLAYVMDEPFDQQHFNAITTQSNIHKLTYQRRTKQGSYYDVLWRQFLG